MIPRLHLPLQKIKLLVGRSRVLEGMAGGRNAAIEEGFRSEFDATQTKALGKFRADSPNSDTLDAFLTESHARIGGLHKPGFFDDADRDTPQAFRAALDVLPNCCCNGCPSAAARGRTCNGDHTDDDLVGENGACLEPIVLWNFRKIRDEVRAHYERYCSPDAGPLDLPDVRLCTEHSALPNTFKVSNWVGGGVEFDDRGATPVSVVSLTLNADELDLDSLHAIPYVLFHEIACHAFSGIRRPPAPGPRPAPEAPCFDEVRHKERHEGPPLARPVTSAADPFAEGWMDFVAFEMCRRVASKQGLVDGAAWLYPHHIAAGWHLHRARADTRDRDPTITDRLHKARGARGRGAAAAADFLLWLRNNHTDDNSEDPGWELFLRVSLDWNVLSRDHVIPRQVFARQIGTMAKNNDHNGLETYRQLILGGKSVTCLVS